MAKFGPMGSPPDPFGSMQNMMGQFQAFMANPMQYLIQRRLNIPQNMVQNPQAAVQHLLDTGSISQQQLNALHQTAQRIQENPQFLQMFGGMR